MDERPLAPVPTDPVTENPWTSLRAFTPARIALGRAGVSQPTRAHLAFQLAHAQARDAVHAELDINRLLADLAAAGHPGIHVHSAAGNRSTYLRRPDLGRRLDAGSVATLREHRRSDGEPYDVVFVVADGLSAFAVQQHAVPLLEETLSALRDEAWRIAPVVVVEQGRVAIGDEVGEILRATLAVVLIGERPGLSSPDSLGVYLTWEPRIGKTDAERNCISNIREAGLSYAAAGRTLSYLMREARRRALSGVALKAPDAIAGVGGPAGRTRGNILVPGA